MSLDLDYYAQREDRTDVINIANKIKSLGYSDGYNADKPQVILVWGNMFHGEIWEVFKVGTKLHDFKPDNENLPQRAKIKLDLKQVSDENPTWEIIREEVFSTVQTTSEAFVTNDFENIA